MDRSAAPEFDKKIILKYDKPGPRYTSYPTAPMFHTGFDHNEYKKAIEETNSDSNPPPISLYFHLPFCKSVCYFCGCNVTFTKNRSLGKSYIDILQKEIEAISSLIKQGRHVNQIHWGGGTPTFIDAQSLIHFYQIIKDNFNIAFDAEIGVEIDPRGTTNEQLEAFSALGFNRISMGIQDFNPKVQKAVHRIQSEELTESAIKKCRKLGLPSINVDLIYGLPFQTTKDFKYTVKKIIEINPDRIAVFNFAYLPELIGHQKAIPRDALPSPEEKLNILEMVINEFTSSGYIYVGMDHFAKPEDELTKALLDRTLTRNFQGYTTKAGCDLYGMGVTSISQVGKCYAQNIKELKPYEEKVLKDGIPTARGIMLTDDDVMRRDIILRLMCHFVLYKHEIEEKYKIRFDETFADALLDLKPMENDGLLKVHNDRIEVLPLGRLLVRNIAMPFDEYLRRGVQARFSRTV